MTIGLGTAILGSSLVGGIMADRSASKQSEAVGEASRASIEEQRRQFDLVWDASGTARNTRNAALEAGASMLGIEVPAYQPQAGGGQTPAYGPRSPADRRIGAEPQPATGMPGNAAGPGAPQQQNIVPQPNPMQHSGGFDPVTHPLTPDEISELERYLQGASPR